LARYCAYLSLWKLDGGVARFSAESISNDAVIDIYCELERFFKLLLFGGIVAPGGHELK